MKDFNRQIINYWKRSKVSNNREPNEQIRNIIKESMEFLKFGCPVRNNEELNEYIEFEPPDDLDLLNAWLYSIIFSITVFISGAFYLRMREIK